MSVFLDPSAGPEAVFWNYELLTHVRMGRLLPGPPILVEKGTLWRREHRLCLAAGVEPSVQLG